MSIFSVEKVSFEFWVECNSIISKVPADEEEDDDNPSRTNLPFLPQSKQSVGVALGPRGSCDSSSL